MCGTILFTGASAGVKGFPQSAPFAMGKFAQRGLAQSMARELHPRGIHVAWINIDGAIRNPGTTEPDAVRAGAFLEACRAHGLLVGKGGLYGNVIRIAPMPNVTEAEMAEGIDAMLAAIDQINQLDQSA